MTSGFGAVRGVDTSANEVSWANARPRLMISHAGLKAANRGMVAFGCSALNHSTLLISVEFATIFPVLPLIPAVFVSLNRDLLVRRPSAS
jgi:hypothetical protein